MKTVKLFVEGGGDRHSLHIMCRKAFNNFLQKSGLTGMLPRIIASGSRKSAYDDYCTAINNGEEAVLLVDSEAAVIIPSDNLIIKIDSKTWKPWHHLKNRRGNDGVLADNWDKPDGASDEDCHLMVQIMETWFFADVDALKRYYGQGFSENVIPKRQDIENISKDDIFDKLSKATNKTQKGKYNKGAHSFEILEIIDPHKVVNQSPWAKRFVDLLTIKMSCSN